MATPVVTAAFDIQPYATQLSIAFGTVVAIVFGVLKMNRAASKNQTEIGEDKASQNILTVALKQRDDAIEAAAKAWAQRTADAVEIATLKAEQKGWIEKEKAYSEDYRGLESMCRRAAARLIQLDPDSAANIFPSEFLNFDDKPHSHFPIDPTG